MTSHALRAVLLSSALIATPAAAAASGPTTLRLRAHALSQHQDGHTFHIRERLTDIRTGKVVGHDRVTCTKTCDGTLFLTTGTLTFRGIPGGGSRARITAATGAYAGRTGTLTVRDTKGDPIVTIILHSRSRPV